MQVVLSFFIKSKPPAELVVCTAPRRRWCWRPDTGPEWTASRIPSTSRRLSGSWVIFVVLN